ncbi:MAG: rhomboid family intramembrane serine protease [Bacteroidales bacterium]|nr:rhomboid family intramembrane serine protease [Bacteroidales bacterium]
MQDDQKKVINSLFIPTLFLFVMWLVKIIEFAFETRLSFLGITPLELRGLIGILASPFLHGDWNHLMANSIPMLVLGAALYYFYPEIANKVLILIILLTGLWVWLGARESTHIGASGVIYGLAAFHMVSGVIRKEAKLMALTLIVVFLYGSMIWGIFPELFPQKNISWESHLSGMIAGIVLAVFYKNEGTQRKRYSWELEETPDTEEDDEIQNPDKASDPPYWNTPEPDKDELTVVYHFKKKSS